MNVIPKPTAGGGGGLGGLSCGESSSRLAPPSGDSARWSSCAYGAEGGPDLSAQPSRLVPRVHCVQLSAPAAPRPAPAAIVTPRCMFCVLLLRCRRSVGAHALVAVLLPCCCSCCAAGITLRGCTTWRHSRCFEPSDTFGLPKMAMSLALSWLTVILDRFRCNSRDASRVLPDSGQF